MATRLGAITGLDDTNNTVLTTSTSIAVVAGDVLCAWTKHEGGATSIIVTDSSGAIGSWVSAVAPVAHSVVALDIGCSYLIATGNATVSVTQTLGSARDWRRVFVEVFRPAGGKTLSLGTGAAAPVTADNGGTAGTAISAGSLTTAGAGAASCFVGEFATVTYTPGSGWTESVDNSPYLEYRLPTGAGSITGDATASASMDWLAGLVFFAESGGSGGSIVVPAGSAQRNRRHTGRH